MTFNSEAYKLVRFLVFNDQPLPFAETLLDKIQNYFDGSITISREDEDDIELSLEQDLQELLTKADKQDKVYWVSRDNYQHFLYEYLHETLQPKMLDSLSQIIQYTLDDELNQFNIPRGQIETSYHDMCL